MEKSTSPTLASRFSAELGGSLLLALVLIIGRLVSGSALETAILMAIVWALLIALLGQWSDQFNPAVTVWKLLTRQIAGMAALIAVLGQFVGSFLGIWAGKGILGALQVPATAVLPQVNPNISSLPNVGWFVVAAECIALVLILLGYLTAMKRDDEASKPLIVGLAVVPAVLVSTVFSGAVLNFAYFTGILAIYHEKLGYWWGYLVGALLAIIIVSLVQMVLDSARRARA